MLCCFFFQLGKSRSPLILGFEKRRNQLSRHSPFKLTLGGYHIERISSIFTLRVHKKTTYLTMKGLRPTYAMADCQLLQGLPPSLLLQKLGAHDSCGRYPQLNLGIP